MADMICIVCPKGCHLHVDEASLAVSGNSCEKGAEYGKTELQNPTRTLTSTVRLLGGTLHRCPVRSSVPIPKSKLLEAAAALEGVTLTAPVKIGQVAVENIVNSGADMIVTRSIAGEEIQA